jgi:hypothetical protein
MSRARRCSHQRRQVNDKRYDDHNRGWASASGQPRLSPHALVQEYLNSTEQLWSIVTNGERLRLQIGLQLKQL